VTSHGALAACDAASKWNATWPSMPSASDPIADRRAKERARSLTDGAENLCHLGKCL
jgi:hypothetical protein